MEMLFADGLNRCTRIRQLLVSIIIPAHNAEATLAKCLEACLEQTHLEIEVIVVDDGSTDATARIAQGFPVHYVRQENRGPAAARNRGATEAKGDILAFTDADCVPEPCWIERLLGHFAEGVVAVGGTYGIANPESLFARMVYEEIAARHARFGEEVDFLGSFNVAYRRGAFEAAGGFDEGFPRASAEDNDLAYRLFDAGGTLRFARDAVVRHYHPTRLWPYLRTQMRHGFWRMKLYAKHPGRVRGDRYAGIGDLLAPPMALILVAVLPVLLISALWPSAFRMILGAAAALAVAYLLLHVALPAQMVRRTRDVRMLLFAGVAILRDLARAMGMLGGLWVFVVMKKRQA